MLAMFMAAVEATIVATAMPTIIAELGGFQLYSWVFASYLLTQAVSIPIYGKLADTFGRKPAFFAGTALFLAGSTLAGFASGMLWLILFRALQGLGAGAIMPVATTIIGDVYTGAERGRVQGYLSSVWGVSAVVGPALGAFFVEHVGWQYVFWLNLPVGVLAVGLLAAFLHEGGAHERHAVDYAGAGLLMAGTATLMLALIQGASLPGWLIGLLVLVSLLCLALFFCVERRAAEPMMPLALWRNRMIAIGNLGQLAAGAVMIAATGFLPTYVQGVLGRSAGVAGFALAAMSIGWPIASTVCGRLLARTSFRGNAVAGAALLVLGSALLALLAPERGGALLAGFGAFVLGVGMGFSNTTYVVGAQVSVAWRERGIATSLNLFMRMTGQALGAAFYGALINFGVQAHVAGGGDLANRLMDPAQRAAIDPALLQRLVHAIGAALQEVYVIGALLAALAVGLALRIPGHLNAHSAAPPKRG
jgi:EmrB/QacA subfamily drug resistance transporter